MNIADHHRPQDGQFSVKTKGRLIDIRVGIIATVYGEMAVLRLLDKSRATLGLSDLGFLPDSLKKFEAMLKVPYGIILVSGPTGAGKTTTLRLLAGLLDISAGSAMVDGHDLKSQSEAIKPHIGYMAQQFSLYGDLMFALPKPIDLIDIKKDEPFSSMILKEAVSI